MNRLITFIKYNNLMPVAVMLVFLGGTAAFAQSDLADTVTELYRGDIVAPDTTLLEDAQLERHDFEPRVISVTEDGRFYLITVNLSDYMVVDNVWSRVEREEILRIRTSSVSSNNSLERKISEEMADIISARRNILVRAQQKVLDTDINRDSSLTDLVGDVDLREPVIASVDPFEAPSGFVAGSYNPDERKNPKQNRFITFVSELLDIFPEEDIDIEDPADQVVVITNPTEDTDSTDTDIEVVIVPVTDTASTTNDQASSSITEITATNTVDATEPIDIDLTSTITDPVATSSDQTQDLVDDDTAEEEVENDQDISNESETLDDPVTEIEPEEEQESLESEDQNQDQEEVEEDPVIDEQPEPSPDPEEETETTE